MNSSYVDPWVCGCRMQRNIRYCNICQQSDPRSPLPDSTQGHTHQQPHREHPLISPAEHQQQQSMASDRYNNMPPDDLHAKMREQRRQIDEQARREQQEQERAHQNNYQQQSHPQDYHQQDHHQQDYHQQDYHQQDHQHSSSSQKEESTDDYLARRAAILGRGAGPGQQNPQQQPNQQQQQQYQQQASNVPGPSSSGSRQSRVNYPTSMPVDSNQQQQQQQQQQQSRQHNSNSDDSHNMDAIVRARQKEEADRRQQQLANAARLASQLSQHDQDGYNDNNSDFSGYSQQQQVDIQFKSGASTCNRGHGLTHVHYPPRQEWGCDRCGRRFQGGESYSCQSDGWDQCESCTVVKVPTSATNNTTSHNPVRGGDVQQQQQQQQPAASVPANQTLSHRAAPANNNDSKGAVPLRNACLLCHAHSQVFCCYPCGDMAFCKSCNSDPAKVHKGISCPKCQKSVEFTMKVILDL